MRRAGHGLGDAGQRYTTRLGHFSDGAADWSSPVALVMAFVLIAYGKASLADGWGKYLSAQ